MLLVTAAMLSCGNGDARPDAATSSTTASAKVAASATATSSASSGPAPPTAEQLAAWKDCASRIAEAEKRPALPGAKKFDAQRVHMARVRGRPMLWRREPAPSPKLDKVLERNESSVAVVRAVRNLIRKTKRREARRKLLLREGYLWADDVRLALALVEQVSLIKLYRDKTIYLRRGVDVYELRHAKRSRIAHERYVYVDGPYVDEKAEILLGDRVSDKREDLDQEHLPIDLHVLMTHNAFDRIRPKHLTKEALVAQVRYGPDVWSPALFELDGPSAKLSCEALTAELAAGKAAFVDGSELLRAAMQRIRSVVRAMVREKIPFDADTDQSNGFMRKAWKRAYFKGWRKFTIDEESYDVYTLDGQPRPPQVCIDFLTDAWERASGNWYAPAVGKKLKAQPKRTEGTIDFDKLKVGNRRSVAEFTKFTLEHPKLFDVWAIPKDKRIAFKHRDRFFEYLHEQADMLRPGDMLSIHGYKHGGRPHYHSIIILEQDPITGIPILVAGNAVFPREQTLEGVMHISPQRSLRHRIRVGGEWLEAVRAKVGEKAQ